MTTNSDAGVVDWESFYPIFAAMEKVGMVLNLHGEVPARKRDPKASSLESGSTQQEEPVSVLNAEALFLPTLHKIHSSFPNLRIVLEHCTTAAALEAVRTCDSALVVATVTAHHLWLTTDEVCGDAFNYCKPVAKTEGDRVALLRAAVGQMGDGLRGRVFFGKTSSGFCAAALMGGYGYCMIMGLVRIVEADLSSCRF